MVVSPLGAGLSTRRQRLFYATPDARITFINGLHWSATRSSTRGVSGDRPCSPIPGAARLMNRQQLVDPLLRRVGATAAAGRRDAYACLPQSRPGDHRHGGPGEERLPLPVSRNTAFTQDVRKAGLGVSSRPTSPPPAPKTTNRTDAKVRNERQELHWPCVLGVRAPKKKKKKARLASLGFALPGVSLEHA